MIRRPEMGIPFPEYDRYDALGLAELVRKREVSPAELVDAAIARIEARNPSCNAVVHRMFDKARTAAAGPLPEGPFRGVPFVLKDLAAAYAGEPLTSGSRFYRDWAPHEHSELVVRFLRAGVVVVGKTASSELGILPVTETARFGPTVTPWDHSRTAGGSSGGSAAAVAARLVPMASGGDGGGSIRIPASCCGVFGLKPTRARNPTGPLEGEAWEGFAVEHVITRSVRDSAAMLDATAGPDVGAPYFASAPARPFAQEVGARPARLRVVTSLEPVLGKTLHPDCRAAAEDAARLLRELGHEVVEAEPPVEGTEFAQAMVAMLAGQTAAEVRKAEGHVGRRATHRDFERSTWMLRLMGEGFTAGEYQVAARTLRRIARRIAVWCEPFDVWLTPTLASPPVRVGALLSRGVMAVGEQVASVIGLRRALKSPRLSGLGVARIFAFVPYTPFANATGQPSMSVPLYWNAEGLPIGVMFTARYGDEATLFRLAAQLEEARPWKDRVPPGL